MDVPALGSTHCRVLPEEIPVPVSRLLPTPEARELIDLVRDVSDRELLPIAATHEREERFPREVFRTLGKAGILGLAYPEEQGGGGQPYEVWLQVLEEIGARWASVAVGVSVHALTCFPLAEYGTKEQQDRWLPDMLGGELLGAYCLSEPDAGSDPGAMRTRAVRTDDTFTVDGVKAWVTHGGHADFYTTMLRTSDSERGGISCLLVPAETAGLSADKPEDKMGLTGSATATMRFDGAKVDADRLHRRGGPGPVDRAGCAGRRPSRDRGRRHRAGAVGPGPRRRLRQGAPHVRQGDHRPPGPRLRARRHAGRRHR